MQATVKKYGFITLCCIPFALAFDCFYAPNGLTCGGFTGVAQIINHFLPFAPVGTVAFLLNLPLFILGLVRHGKGFLLSSLYAVAVSSLFVDVLAAVYTFPPMEPLLACIYGGVILGWAACSATTPPPAARSWAPGCCCPASPTCPSARSAL